MSPRKRINYRDYLNSAHTYICDRVDTLTSMGIDHAHAVKLADGEQHALDLQTIRGLASLYGPEALDSTEAMVIEALRG